jgi:hypothetical protein
MTKKKFQGTGTALVTPFKKDGSIDEPACGGWSIFRCAAEST